MGVVDKWLCSEPNGKLGERHGNFEANVLSRPLPTVNLQHATLDRADLSRPSERPTEVVFRTGRYDGTYSVRTVCITGIWRATSELQRRTSRLLRREWPGEVEAAGLQSPATELAERRGGRPYPL